MRLFLAAALAASALAFASPGSGHGLKLFPSDDCDGCCKRCHATGGEGLEEPSEPEALDLSKSDWGTATASRRWDELRRRLSATNRHE